MGKGNASDEKWREQMVNMRMVSEMLKHKAIDLGNNM